jgi:hypothetical protein
LLLLPLVWLAPLLGDPTQVHNTPDSKFSDLVIAHWPSAEFLRRSISQNGEIPMWNPHTLGGTPFAADPLSGLYYPPLWLALIIPAPLAFNLLFFLHLAFAGVGAYRLAKEEGSGEAGSLLAGIAFGGLPKFVGHTAAGHLSLVLAVSWTPWLFLAARGAARTRSIRRWSLTGLMTGIVFLIDPRWMIPAAAAALAYAAVPDGGPPSGPRRLQALDGLKHLAVFAAFAAAVAAVLALPMALFVSQSTRMDLPAVEKAAYSLPVLSLGGMIFGGIESNIEWVVYPGAVILVLALAFPLLVRARHPPAGDGAAGQGKGWFWFGLFLIAVLLSLGSNVPGLGALMDAVPGVNLLRVPPRWMFLAGLALALLAPRGLSALESAEDGRGLLKKGGFTLAAGGFLFAAAAGLMGWPSVLWQNGLVWGGLGLILFLGFPAKRWSPPAGYALLFLAVVDLAVADVRMIDPRPGVPFPGAAAEIAARIRAEDGEARVYSPSYAVPHLVALQNGLRMLDGVDPLILQSTAETVSAAAGVPWTGYSVALPAFKTGNPETDNRNAVPDWRLLDLLNVRFIASAFEIPGAAPGGCETVGGGFLCRNPAALPRAWVAEGPDAWETPVAGREPGGVAESPNRMSLTAAGPGLLVISEASYPAWKAKVDGKAAELITVGGWWRAVEIGPGNHTVDLEYDAQLSVIGLSVTLLALLAFCGVRRWAR